MKFLEFIVEMKWVLFGAGVIAWGYFVTKDAGSKLEKKLGKLADEAIREREEKDDKRT